MIRDLDASLRAMLTGEARPRSELASATISFAVPDGRWRAAGSGLHLDVYLFGIQHDRELQSTERRRSVTDRVVAVEPAPSRVACHYLITAWNKADPAGGDVEAQEHRLLSQVLDVLLRNPVMPERYLAGLAGTVAPKVVTAEPDGPGVGAEFWTGLGTPLRPSITVRLRAALPPRAVETGPTVTTVVMQFPDGDRFQIGGRVSGPAGAVAGAWVRIADSGETTETDDDGRFVLPVRAAGEWTLQVRAVGFRPADRQQAVPDPDGRYDVALEPL